MKYPNGKTFKLSSVGAEEVENAERNLGVETGAAITKSGSTVLEGGEGAEKIATQIAEQARKGSFTGGDGASIADYETELFRYDQSIGTLPTDSELLGLGTSLPATVLGVGAFWVGWEIGSAACEAFVCKAIKGFLGLEGTSENKVGSLTGEVYLLPYDEAFTENFTGNRVEYPRNGVAIVAHTNTGYGINSPLEWMFSVKEASKCPEPSAEYMLNPDRMVTTVPIIEESEECYESGRNQHELTERYKVGVYLGETNFGKSVYNYFRSDGGKWPQENEVKPSGEYAKKTGASGKATEIHEIERPEELKTAPPKPKIETKTSEGNEVTPTAPPIVTTHIITELEKAKKLEGENEGTPQETLTPELPNPRPTETGTEYKTELESDGWTKVELKTLPESAVDSQVGPEDVAYTVPSSGSYVSYETTVTVEQNPADAPTPEESGALGPPNLPGFKMPNFGALCKGFPFGVPCWLISTIESWSGAASAPEWGFESFSLLGHTIAGKKFQLSRLEPIMSKVRVAMILFCTVGLVLLFYNFAKGGSPPSGGGTSDVGGGAKEVTTEYDDDGTEYRVGW